MSLPLPRRIAQAALLVGAAAAPLLGAGSAHAAALSPRDLGGPATLDGAALGRTVDTASHHATVLASDTGAEAVRSTLPVADHLVGTMGRTALPAARQAAGDAQDAAGRIAGETAESAATALPDSEVLPTSSLLPNLGALPSTAALPADRLPLKSLPAA